MEEACDLENNPHSQADIPYRNRGPGPGCCSWVHNGHAGCSNGNNSLESPDQEAHRLRDMRHRLERRRYRCQERMRRRERSMCQGAMKVIQLYKLSLDQRRQSHRSRDHSKPK